MRRPNEEAITTTINRITRNDREEIPTNFKKEYMADMIKIRKHIKIIKGVPKTFSIIGYKSQLKQNSILLGEQNIA